MAFTLSTQHAGNVAQQMLAVNEEEKRQNRELMKKLIRSLYFLTHARGLL